MLGRFMPMKKLSVPISEARSDLCALIKQVQAGARVTLTSHGRPAAQLVPVDAPPMPWRVKPADDPRRYGDLQSPVLEPWP
jgi:prevent-host-death family protein